MKKKLMTVLTATVLSTAMSVIAFATGWQQNTTGWWYGTNADNSQWYSSGWQWLDGNNDGTAECYYFGGNGYMAVNTTTPDGYQVNENGAWIVDSIVQEKRTQEYSTEVSALDNMIGKWKLTEVKQGFVENSKNIYSLTGFNNISHWADWNIAYSGLQDIEIQKEGTEYFLIKPYGYKEQFSKFDDKTLSLIQGSSSRTSTSTASVSASTAGISASTAEVEDKSQINSYYFMDGDHLVITGTDFFFIANNNETRSGSYFLGYYTKQN